MKKSRVSLSLEVLISSPSIADLLAKSLKPDNEPLPGDLRLEITIVTSDTLKISIEAEDVGTAMNTINDVFTCLQPVIKLLSKG
ncbi:MAG: KEOPS complex subunit Pcc1 [Candidatus Nezhaarchaeales archaeon]